MTEENPTILTNKILINPEKMDGFVDWQGKLNAAIAMHPGFVSLEILSPVLPEQPEWLVVQRFYAPSQLMRWQQSESRKDLMKELENYLQPGKKGIQEVSYNPSHMSGGITEVFVTQVSPENEKAYREWFAKIHQVEAKFPGFKGVYMQSPTQTGGINWITLLQFDTPENLDNWLNSKERKRVLDEGHSLISSFESHRMISPYAGWFASVAKTGKLPPVWKQTMIILLVLFPIVMFEIKYLNPLLKGLNTSPGTFISNAISVTLISWPMMPIAIFFLSWWLTAKSKNQLRDTIKGTLLVIFLYLIEIAIFWNFV